jgi:hypothetical protein
VKIVYVYFDINAPYPGWEYRTSELLCDIGHEVYTIPRHRCLYEGRIPIPKNASVVYCSNPMAVDVALKVKEHLKAPLIVNFLDVPKALFGSEEWRIKEYERVKEQVKQADFITAISETTAKDVEEWLGRKVDCVNYLGVDLDVYQAFQSKTGDYVCGVVRGLAKQKRAEEIIRAVETSKTKPKLELIYGNLSDPQKAKIMSRCIMGLGMSTLEGFAIYLCEFGYYAKPFIGKRLPVFEEIYGDNIIYVEKPEEMAEKIDWLVNDQVARTLAGSKLKRTVEEKKLFLSEHALRLEKMLCSISETS